MSSLKSRFPQTGRLQLSNGGVLKSNKGRYIPQSQGVHSIVFNAATNLVTDGNMEAAGTSSWTTSGATLSKTTSPYPVFDGSQSLQITSSSSGYASQALTVVSGNCYRFTGYFYVGQTSGSSYAVLGATDGVNPTKFLLVSSTNLNYSTWNRVEMDFVPFSTTMTIYLYTGGLANVAYWDDVSVYIVQNTNAGMEVDSTRLSTLGVRPGKFGDALRVWEAGEIFSVGTGTQLTGNNYQFINTNQGTISFWVKPFWAGSDNTLHYFFGGGITSGHQVYKGTTNHLYTTIVISGSVAATIDCGSISSWSANTWHHILVRWDSLNVVATSNYLETYIDGTLSGTYTSTWSAGLPGAGYHVGSNGSSAPFQGLIDDLYISGRVLTPTEISTLYNSGTGTAAAQFVDYNTKLYLPFDLGDNLSASNKAQTGSGGPDWTSSGNLVEASSIDSFFETATVNSGTLSTGWNLIGTPTTSAAETANIIFDTRSQKVVTAGTNSGISSNTITIANNTNYTVSMWLKVTSGTIFVQLATNVTNYSSPSISTSGWQLYTWTFTTTTDTSFTINIADTGSAATFYIDNVGCWVNLVANPSFEGTYVSGIAPSWLQGGGALTGSASTAHFGSHGQKVVTSASNANIQEAAESTTSVNSFYLADVWYNVTAGTETLQIYRADATTLIKSLSSTASSYTRLGFSFKALDTSSLLVNSGANNTTAYMDDASIIPLLSPTFTPTYVNGAFPYNSNGYEIPNGWSAYGAPTSINEENVIVHSGLRSVKVVANAAPQGIASNTYTTVNGHTYVVSAWIYPTTSGMVRCFLVDGSLLRQQVLLANQWQKLVLYYVQSGTSQQIEILNENGGSLTYYIDDVSSLDNVSQFIINPTINNNRFLTNEVNGYMSFNGTSQFLQASQDYAYYKTLNTFTLGCWFQVTNTTQDGILIMKGLNAAGNRTYQFYYNHTIHYIYGVVFGNDSTISQHGNPYVIVDDGQWHFACMRFDGTNQSIFVDNTKINSTYSKTLQDTTVVLTIGAATNGVYFGGNMHNVFFYDYAITDAEVYSIYDMGAEPNLNYNNLVLWIPGTSGSATDISPIGATFS